VLPRPSFRLPLWTVPPIVAGLYAARSLLRGSWRPEMPLDAVVLVMVVVVMVIVARLRAMDSDGDGEQDANNKRGTSRSDAGGPTD
jgi:hypothetical protein